MILSILDEFACRFVTGFAMLLFSDLSYAHQHVSTKIPSPHLRAFTVCFIVACVLRDIVLLFPYHSLHISPKASKFLRIFLLCLIVLAQLVMAACTRGYVGGVSSSATILAFFSYFDFRTDPKYTWSRPLKPPTFGDVTFATWDKDGSDSWRKDSQPQSSSKSPRTPSSGRKNKRLSSYSTTNDDPYNTLQTVQRRAVRNAKFTLCCW